ncbi:hypothetical protein F5B19DRAFT_211810 [Rostrohypoxylon terebratum]|nr:hypothetical protein F5B19DRAFT_211810 [Rostrohypoxylon terebratum]
MRVSAFLLNTTLLASSAWAWRGPIQRAEVGSSPQLPSPSPNEPPSPGPTPTPGNPGPSPSGPPGGPKCGKGYTYCGYMLTSSGHNFGSADISKAYCNGLQELCADGKPKTDVSEAVFVCMNEQPSSIELLCACSGKCRNDAETNFIAHCDKPCINN